MPEAFRVERESSVVGSHYQHRPYMSLLVRNKYYIVNNFVNNIIGVESSICMVSDCGILLLVTSFVWPSHN